MNLVLANFRFSDSVLFRTFLTVTNLDIADCCDGVVGCLTQMLINLCKEEIP